MTPSHIILSTVVGLAGVYLGEWVSAHRAGNRRVAVAARDGLVMHLAFGSIFLVVVGIAP